MAEPRRHDEPADDGVLELFAPDPTREERARRRTESELLVVFLLAALAAMQRSALGARVLSWENALLRGSVSPEDEAAARAVVAGNAQAATVFHVAQVFATLRAAELSREVSLATRRTVSRLLNEALQQHLSPEAFRARLEASGVFGTPRARRIAVTEFVRARNRGQAAAFGAAGVREVLISDGDHDRACREADGQTWPLSRYVENPLEHPNCRRSADAVMEEAA